MRSQHLLAVTLITITLTTANPILNYRRKDSPPSRCITDNTYSIDGGIETSCPDDDVCVNLTTGQYACITPQQAARVGPGRVDPDDVISATKTGFDISIGNDLSTAASLFPTGVLNALGLPRRRDEHTSFACVESDPSSFWVQEAGGKWITQACGAPGSNLICQAQGSSGGNPCVLASAAVQPIVAAVAVVSSATPITTAPTQVLDKGLPGSTVPVSQSTVLAANKAVSAGTTGTVSSGSTSGSFSPSYNHTGGDATLYESGGGYGACGSLLPGDEDAYYVALRKTTGR